MTINGAILSSTSHAVVFTPDQALVWAYNVNTSIPETFDVELPRPAKYQHQAAPLGCLVTPLSSGEEPGLVVIQPATGKITYWESIVSAAASAAFGSHRIGVEGAVPLLSGETVTGIQAVDPAGYVVILSTGRLAHLCLHDSHGKSTVHLQVVRGAADHANGGGLGSWFQTLTSKTSRREIAAVRSGGSVERGQRQVIVATVKGDIQLWSFNRNRQTSLLIEADAREELISASRPRSSKASDWTEYDFSLLDIAYLSTEETSLQLLDRSKLSTPAVRILVLVLNQTNVSFVYHLIELEISSGSPRVINSQAIKNYDSPIHHRQYGLPRLLLPDPGHTAFIIFAQSVVILSRNTLQPTPPDSQQLLVEATAPAWAARSCYEDVVDFCQDRSIRVVAVGAEDALHADAHSNMPASLDRRTHVNPACVLLVEGVGLVRLTANAGLDESKKRPKVTPKSKMEQAVFYGKIAENILDLANRVPLWFKPEAIDEATLRISTEILNGGSKYMLPGQDSLTSRKIALLALSGNVQEYYPSVSQLTKWQVLGNLEKLIAAEALLDLGSSESKDFLIEMIHNQPDIDAASVHSQESGVIADYLLAHVVSLQSLAPAPYATFVRSNMLKNRKSAHQIVSGLRHAIACFMAIYDSSLQYRLEHAADYKLITPNGKPSRTANQPEHIPELWTSSGTNLAAAKHLVQLAAELLAHSWEDSAGSNEELNEIADKLPRLISILCSLYTERIASQLHGQDETDGKADSKTGPSRLEMEYDTVRHDLIASLSQLNQFDRCYELAERYQDCRSMATLILRQYQVFEAELLFEQKLDHDVSDGVKGLEKRMQRYTEMYGIEFATQYFEECIRTGFPIRLLNLPPFLQDHFTQYCQTLPKAQKLDAIRQLEAKRWSKASEELLRSADVEMEEAWGRQTESGLAKLTALAASGTAPESTLPMAEVDTSYKMQNEIQETQGKLYRHMYSSIRAALDPTEQLNIAMADFGHRYSKFEFPKRYLRQCLRNLFDEKPLKPIELIEILTMIDQQRDYEITSGIAGNQFWLALRTLHLSRQKLGSRNTISAVERTIWRRCIERDNWKEIAKIKGAGLARDRAIEGTALYQTLKQGYALGKQHSSKWSDHMTTLANTILFAVRSDASYEFRPLSPDEASVVDWPEEEMAAIYQLESKKMQELLIREQKREAKALHAVVQDLNLQAWEDLRTVVKKVVEDEEVTRKEEYEALVQFTRKMDVQEHEQEDATAAGTAA